MSHMSRKEIDDLYTQFVTRLGRLKKQHGTIPSLVGLGIVKKELDVCNKTQSTPSVKLRHYGRLMKHYMEEASSKPDALHGFNVAVECVERGDDPQTAIKAARRAVRQKEVDGHISRPTALSAPTSSEV